MYSLQQVLETLGAPLVEEQVWALACVLSEAVIDDQAHSATDAPGFPCVGNNGNWSYVLTCETVRVHTNGAISLNMAPFKGNGFAMLVYSSVPPPLSCTRSYA